MFMCSEFCWIFHVHVFFRVSVPSSCNTSQLHDFGSPNFLSSSSRSLSFYPFKSNWKVSIWGIFSLFLWLLLTALTAAALRVLALNFSQSLISTFRLNWFHGSEWKSSSVAGRAWAMREDEEKFVWLFVSFSSGLFSFLLFYLVSFTWHNRNEIATMVRLGRRKSFAMEWTKERKNFTTIQVKLDYYQLNFSNLKLILQCCVLFAISICFGSKKS